MIHKSRELRMPPMAVENRDNLPLAYTSSEHICCHVKCRHLPSRRRRLAKAKKSLPSPENGQGC